MALILVVDDCEPVRHTLRRMLESRQHRVVMAEGRLEALELWRQRGADLVLLDLQLPDRDAIDTVTQFRGAAPELPIIAMASGDRSGLDVLADAYLLGVKAVLPKPFHLHQVLDLVARVLGTDEASEAGWPSDGRPDHPAAIARLGRHRHLHARGQHCGGVGAVRDHGGKPQGDAEGGLGGARGHGGQEAPTWSPPADPAGSRGAVHGSKQGDAADAGRGLTGDAEGGAIAWLVQLSELPIILVGLEAHRKRVLGPALRRATHALLDVNCRREVYERRARYTHQPERTGIKFIAVQRVG